MRTFALAISLLWPSLTLATPPSDKPSNTRLHTETSHHLKESLNQLWAKQYLFNALFLYEYWFIKNLETGATKLGKTLKEKIPPLWQRADFAAYALVNSKQSLPHFAQIVRAISTQSTKPASTQGRIHNEEDFERARNTFAASFDKPLHRKLGVKLMSAYRSTVPNPCAPEIQDSALSSPSDLSPELAQHQTADASLAQGSLPSPFCNTVHALYWLSAPSQDKDSSMARRAQLDQLKASWAKLPSFDPDLAPLQALSSLIEGNYPSTLQLLLQLQSHDETYRLGYEIVQRLYSLHEKGSGRVALQGP